MVKRNGGAARRPSRKPLCDQLAPLIELFSEFDHERLRLEQHGGTTASLKRLQAILNREIVLSVHHQELTIRLVEPASFRQLSRLTQHELRIQVRTHAVTRWPCYLLARQFRAHPRPFVSDVLHRSPDYPAGPDPTFLSLHGSGGERLYLNLAEALKRDLPDQGYAEPELRSIARIGNLMWHPDQCIHRLVADWLRVPVLTEALELCYIALASTRLYSPIGLRDPVIAEFLTRTRRTRLLELLNTLDTERWHNRYGLEERFKAAYDHLSHAFLSLLMTPVVWELERHARVPLYKLIYANVNRLDPDYEGFHSVCTHQLEEAAEETIRKLMSAVH